MFLTLLLSSLEVEASDCDNATSQKTELYLGRSIWKAGEISDLQLYDFLENFAAVKLSAQDVSGFTIVPAHGHWRSESGDSLESERSLVLIVLYSLEMVDEVSEAIDEIAEAYRKRFHQISVLRIDHQVCQTSYKSDQ